MQNIMLKKITFVWLVSILLLSTSSNVFCITEAPNLESQNFEELSSNPDLLTDDFQISLDPPDSSDKFNNPSSSRSLRSVLPGLKIVSEMIPSL